MSQGRYLPLSYDAGSHVATDSSTQVKFANQMNLPFLAINRGHGSVSALGTFKHGVLIKLANLTSIDIAADGKSAVLGG